MESFLAWAPSMCLDGVVEKNEHCEIDNGTVQCDYIADWIAENFGMSTG
jgi:hypothetical protein